LPSGEIVDRINEEDTARPLPLLRDDIYTDVAVIRKQWQQDKLQNVDVYQSTAIAKFDNLERVYWQHYNRTDDIKALSGVAHCIVQRSTIQGLYQLGTPAGNNVNVVFSWGADAPKPPDFGAINNEMAAIEADTTEVEGDYRMIEAEVGAGDEAEDAAAD